jgi:hypothetical protein
MRAVIVQRFACRCRAVFWFRSAKYFPRIVLPKATAQTVADFLTGAQNDSIVYCLAERKSMSGGLSLSGAHPALPYPPAPWARI